MIAMENGLNTLSAHNAPGQQEPEETPENELPHTLDEIQRRAFRIHRRHGGVYGGYTLEEWLEAEHELEHEESPAPGKIDRVH
ncbi:MAG: hypothetical protein WA211_21065 [Candidatus Acidiferrales bacterium]